MIKTALLILICVPLFIFADLNSKMNRCFNSYGSMGNLSKGGVYNGQRAGYMTGGGLAISNRITNDKIITLKAPTFNAGCGGIDIYAGGMSFISGSEIVAQLKSVASNAAGYSLMLSMEAASPLATNVIKQMQQWSNWANGLNINSCETASAAVGSVWPRHTMASQQICRDMAGRNGFMSDYVTGRHQCANRDSYNSIMKQVESENPDMLKEEFNLAWEAVNRQGGCGDQEEKELLMSLMGTIIVRKDGGGKLERIVIPGKSKDDAFLQALLNGGNLNKLTCNKNDGGRCLNLIGTELIIDHANSWIGKVENKLNRIQDKILSEQSLDEDEITFIAKSRLPLFKIINALTAYKRGYCPVEINQVANIVAVDVLMQYLRETIEILRSGCIQLKGSEFYSGDIDDYLKELAWIEKSVAQHETYNRDLLLKDQYIRQMVEKIEQELSTEIIIQ